MKFQENDVLYYVCPFQFSIELVKIIMVVQETDGLNYIEQSGAYLKEYDLHDNIFSAQEDAYKKLTDFYNKKTYEILYNIPKPIKE